MPLLSQALGSVLDPRTVEVTPRMLLAFAAGIGETGPHTFDDAAPEFVASRCFCAPLEWPVISQERRASLLGLSQEELRRGVHVEQDSTFHRLIRPGDRLETRGRIVAITRTSAGAFVQSKLITTDATDGARVTTSFYGTIFRGIDMTGAGGVLESAPSCPMEPSLFLNTVTIPIAAEASHLYTECSGIWNPIHTERRVALDAGLPGTILHGTAIWALAGRELVRHYAGRDPERLLRLRARFRAPVIPGTLVTIRHGPGASDGDVHFQIQIDGGATAADGYAAFAPARSSIK
jgi:acyl dehydratase